MITHYTLQTVNMQFEITTCWFSKIVSNTCFHHVYNTNTRRSTWTHCHMYCVNRDYPHGHMVITHWLKMPCSGTYIVSQNVRCGRRRQV